MSLPSSQVIRIEPLRVHASGADRRRAPRFEAIGPGQLCAASGEELGVFRLIDECRDGLGCLSRAVVEVGQMVRVRVGSASEWKPAVVVNSNAVGPLRRFGIRYAD